MMMWWSSTSRRKSWRRRRNPPLSAVEQLTLRECGLVAAQQDDRSFWRDAADTTERLQIIQRLPLHNGCVNALSWNEEGSLLLSGADDRCLVVSDPFTADDDKLVKARITTGHRSNIFSACFVPATDNQWVCSAGFSSLLVFGFQLVSCASDGSVAFNNVEVEENRNGDLLLCHRGTAYEVTVIKGDPNSALSCGEDGCVRWFDRREKTACQVCSEDVVVNCGSGGTSTCAIDVHPTRAHLLAVGCSDAVVRFYDLRKVTKPCRDATGYIGLESCLTIPSRRIAAMPRRDESYSSPHLNRVTSLDFSRSGAEILVSFSSDDVFIFSMNNYCEQKQELWTSREESTGAERPLSANKIRLRGDWSDTGPDARPVRSPSETSDSPPPPRRDQTPIVHRFRAFLTHWMEQRLTETTAEGGRTQTAASSSSVGLGQNTGQSSALVSVPECTTDAERRKNLEDKSVSNLDGNDNNENQQQLDWKQKLLRKRRLLLKKLVESVPQHCVVASFGGHRNCRTVLKQACFWGDEHVISGSDCGHLFVWSRRSGRVVLAAVGDTNVVNCVQAHPQLPILASSGIEYNVKLWTPNGWGRASSQDYITELVKRNEHMLKETQGTVTIPASFLIRIIAAVNRRERQLREDEGEGEGEQSEAGEEPT